MRKIAYQTPLSAFFVLVSAVYALMIMHKNDNAMVNTVTQKQRCTEEVCDWWGAPCVNALRTTRRVDQLPAAAGLCFAYAHSNMHREKCQLTILLFNTSSKQTNKTFPDWLWRVPSKRTTKRKKKRTARTPLENKIRYNKLRSCASVCEQLDKQLGNLIFYLLQGCWLVQFLHLTTLCIIDV